MKAPNRDDIVKEALKEINPAANKRVACEKEIRNYLSILDEVHADLGKLPTPAQLREQLKQDASALRKVKIIAGMSPKDRFPNLFRGLGTFILPVDRERFLDDLRRLIKTADWQAEHIVVRKGSKPVDPVKRVAECVAAPSLIKKFATGRPSKARVAAVLQKGVRRFTQRNFLA
jgi:hypothetical protein